MICRPQIGRFLAGSLFGLAALAGCSSHDFAAAATTALADRPQPPGAASTAEPTPPAHLSVAAAAAATPGWTSSTPTLPRAVSQPDPYVFKGGYAPPVTGGIAKPQTAMIAAEQRDLRVMTFNLRVRTIFDGLNIWDMRRDTVVQCVRNFNPDLFGTQEGLDSQEDFLRQQLPDYTFFGVGRDNGKRGGEMCGVFFRTTRFELLDGGHFWLSSKPFKPGSHGWGALFPRMVTWVKLRPRDGSGPAFCWFNTHFDAWNGRARSESAHMLISWMDIIAARLPRVVTGDFNATPGSDPYQTLVNGRRNSPETALADAFRVANPVAVHEEGTMHNFSGRRDGNRIDWILATPQFQVLGAAIDRTRGSIGYPSDHFPVTATLRALPAPAAAAAPAAVSPARTAAPAVRVPVARIE